MKQRLKAWWRQRFMHRTGRVHDRRDGKSYWGDSIQFVDDAPNRIVGWMTPRPLDGDILLWRDGKSYLIYDVEFCRDLKDMFFASVQEVTTSHSSAGAYQK